jgi:hypothetical protein
MKNFLPWLYVSIIVSGWINILVICVGSVIFLGIIFGSTNVTSLGTSTLEEIVRIWINYYLWAWLAIPSIIALWQAIRSEKKEKKQASPQED